MMNAELEAAYERYSEAVRKHRIAVEFAKKIIREADEEYQAANENLTKYEISPGIPKPEYRS